MLVTPAFMSQQIFLLLVELELILILFILDESADSFLHQPVDCLLCQNSENGEKCRHNEPKVTPSACLFVPTNSPKLHKHIHIIQRKNLHEREAATGSDATGNMKQ